MAPNNAMARGQELGISNSLKLFGVTVTHKRPGTLLSGEGGRGLSGNCSSHADATFE